MPSHSLTNTPVSPAGLILSLATELDRSSPLARSARRLARRLAHSPRPSRNLTLETADLTALLLDVCDSAGGYSDGDECLDEGWDA